MKNLRCWLFGHPIDEEQAEFLRIYECTRCGEFEPDDGVIPHAWWKLKRWSWNWYSWLFIPCHWCGRFSWDWRGHKGGDNGCVPF